MYILGFDIPLVELLFIFAILLLVIVVMAIVWFAKLKREEKEMVQLMDILIKLDEAEINHLRKLETLTAEEKRIIEDISSLKKIGLTKAAVKPMKKKKSVLKQIVYKISAPPKAAEEKKQEAPIMPKIRLKINQGIAKIEKGIYVIGKDISGGARKLGRGLSSGLKNAGKNEKSVTRGITSYFRKKSEERKAREAEKSRKKSAEEKRKAKQRRDEERREQKKRRKEEERKLKAKKKHEAELRKVIQELKRKK